MPEINLEQSANLCSQIAKFDVPTRKSFIQSLSQEGRKTLVKMLDAVENNRPFELKENQNLIEITTQLKKKPSAWEKVKKESGGVSSSKVLQKLENTIAKVKLLPAQAEIQPAKGEWRSASREKTAEKKLQTSREREQPTWNIKPQSEVRPQQTIGTTRQRRSHEEIEKGILEMASDLEAEGHIEMAQAFREEAEKSRARLETEKELESILNTPLPEYEEKAEEEFGEATIKKILSQSQSKLSPQRRKGLDQADAGKKYAEEAIKSGHEYLKEKPANYAAAREEFNRAATFGDPKAYFHLAELDMSQKEKDPLSAIKNYEKGANLGEINCQLQLARIYISKKEYVKANEWLQKADDQMEPNFLSSIQLIRSQLPTNP